MRGAWVRHLPSTRPWSGGPGFEPALGFLLSEEPASISLCYPVVLSLSQNLSKKRKVIPPIGVMNIENKKTSKKANMHKWNNKLANSTSYQQYMGGRS